MNGVLFCWGGLGWSLGDPLLKQRFELFGGFAVFFELFLFLPAAGDGGEFVGALGAFVGGGAVGRVEGVARAGRRGSEVCPLPSLGQQAESAV